MSKPFVLVRLLALLLVTALPVRSQNGLHLLKRFDHKHGTTSGVSYSGSWGYVGPDGREYALLGTATGTAIIEITDTANVHEIAHIAGPTSIWREMRTWGHYLYIVSEGGSGTQIVDLSSLPDTAALVQSFVYAQGSLNTLRSHTIEIFDGYMYLNGCANWSPGGTLIFSLADPENPQYLGAYDPPGSLSEQYVHDCYVRHDTIYAASIYTNGGLNIGSVADKSAPVHIAKISYAGSGTHNAWTTTDGRYAITTDEIGSTVKSLKFWDLSSLPTPPASPAATYQFSPLDIEHNVFVRGSYAYTAWYTAGIVVVDIHDPTAPFGAGWYDTSNDTLYPPGNYDGVWAVCPYFWSGKVTAGDMQNGLYIFSFDSLQARTPVSLLEPADGENICAPGPLAFRWSRASDPLKDPVSYRLHIFGPSYDSTFSTGSDTSFVLPDPRLLGAGPLSWHVLTADDINRISSQDTFTVGRPFPSLTGPNGGESIKIFSQAAISWGWTCADSIAISLSTDDGASWSPLAVVPDTQHSFIWNVPALPTALARIRVRDAADTTRSDVSDSAFTIFNSASIALTSPQGGDLLHAETVHQITWSSVLVDSLMIEYSGDDGSTWETVTADTPAAPGSYDWNVPATYTSRGFIRLTDLSNGTVFAENDAPFLIGLITLSMQEGWNLTSLPVDPVDQSVSANFPYAVSPAFAYAGNYTDATSLTHGIGYWIKYGSPRTIAGLGPLVPTDTIPLAKQWNMIGSVSTTVAVSSLIAEPDSIILSNFFGYSADSGYTVIDSLVPGRGYWVKASMPGALIVGAAAAAPGTRIRIVPSGEMPPPPPGGGSAQADLATPPGFALGQNYPNPFNPTTTLAYQISEEGIVSLKIYDLLGREMAVLAEGDQRPGYYTATWNAANVSSGVYYARLDVADGSGNVTYRQTIKLVVQK